MIYYLKVSSLNQLLTVDYVTFERIFELFFECYFELLFEWLFK